ncbi:hypothetical protein GCM10027605_41250 [Micromonospora zhanjiangensis]
MPGGPAFRGAGGPARVAGVGRATADGDIADTRLRGCVNRRYAGRCGGAATSGALWRDPETLVIVPVGAHEARSDLSGKARR